MTRFYIPELIPIEYPIRDESLRFLAEVRRNGIDFSGLIHDRAAVKNMGDKNYLTAGNQRATLNLINEEFYIDAEDDCITSVSTTISSARYCSKQGINSFFDLVLTVQNPLQFSYYIPPTCTITTQQLEDPRFFLRF